MLTNCRSGPDGLSPHGDLGVACHVRSQMEPRPEIRDLVWYGEARPERYESYLATRSSFFTRASRTRKEEVCREPHQKRCCARDGGSLALQRRPPGAGAKPPGAALAEDCRGERSGRRRGVIASGGDQEDVPEPLRRDDRRGVRRGGVERN